MVGLPLGLGFGCAGRFYGISNGLEFNSFAIPQEGSCVVFLFFKLDLEVFFFISRTLDRRLRCFVYLICYSSTGVSVLDDDW